MWEEERGGGVKIEEAGFISKIREREEVERKKKSVRK